MSERLPERGLGDLISETFDLLLRAPLFLFLPFFCFELAWQITFQFFESSFSQLIERTSGELASMRALVTPMLAGLVAVFAALVVLVILYSYLLAIAQLAAREAMAQRKITLAAALQHAKIELFPTMNRLGWFSLVFVPPILLLSVGIVLSATGSIGIGIIFICLAIAGRFVCSPLFRVAFGVGAMTELRGKSALAAGWDVAKERIPELFGLAMILVLVSVIASVINTVLSTPIPSGLDLSSFDVNALLQLDKSKLMKMLFASNKMPLWVSFYEPVADALSASCKEAFAYTLIGVWFARRSVPSPLV
jgi:hypothetical protein